MVIPGGWVFLMSEVSLYQVSAARKKGKVFVAGPGRRPAREETACDKRAPLPHAWPAGQHSGASKPPVQGYRAHKKHRPPRTLH